MSWWRAFVIHRGCCISGPSGSSCQPRKVCDWSVVTSRVMGPGRLAMRWSLCWVARERTHNRPPSLLTGSSTLSSRVNTIHRAMNCWLSHGREVSRFDSDWACHALPACSPWLALSSKLTGRVAVNLTCRPLRYFKYHTNNIVICYNRAIEAASLTFRAL